MKQIFRFLSLAVLLSVMSFGVAHAAPALAPKGSGHAVANPVETASAADARDSAFSAHE